MCTDFIQPRANWVGNLPPREPKVILSRVSVICHIQNNNSTSPTALGLKYGPCKNIGIFFLIKYIIRPFCSDITETGPTAQT